MKSYSRWLLLAAAVVLMLTGAGAGWLVAVLRRGSVSDAVVSAIVTGLFTFLGAAIGLLVPMVQDWERNRPNLKLKVTFRCLHASPGLRMASETLFPSTLSPASLGNMMTSWIRCDPDSREARLFVLLDVQVQNRSHLDDAITEITIELPSRAGTARVPAKLPDGSEFLGESVPAHQLRPIQLRLMLDAASYRDTPTWQPKPGQIWHLTATTINDQILIEPLEPAGHFPAYVQEPVDELDVWGGG